MAIRYTNIKLILDRILRDPIFVGLTYEAVVDYYTDFLSIVLTPEMFMEKSVTLNLQNYRAELPYDFLEPIQVLLEGTPSTSATDTFHISYAQLEAEILKKPNIVTTTPITHKFENGYLYASIPNGTAIISYYAIPIINNELAVPDDGVFLRAFQRYVEVEFLRMLYRNSRIPRQVLDAAEQQYAWAVGQYETHSQRFDLSKAESFANSFNQLILNRNEFSKRFKQLGSK